jgi:CBS domain-containing protein
MVMMERTEPEKLVAVGEIMDRELVTVPYEGTLEDALTVMIERDRDSVLVMDGLALAGVIGSTDIGRLVAKGVDLHKAMVRDFVAACLLTGNNPCVQVREDESVINVLKVMDSWAASQVVVVGADDRVAGTVTMLEALKGWKKGF